MARNVSPKTLSNYRWALRSIRHLVNLPSEPYEVELVLAEASASGRLGTESIFTLWRRLRDFFEWTSSRYQIPNPFIRPNPWGSKPHLLIAPPVRPEQLPKVLSPSQVRLLLYPGCRSKRDRLMVLLPLDTGLRLAEIAALTKGDIAPDLLRVKSATAKGRKMREVPLSKEIFQELLFVGDANHPWLSKHTGAPLTRWGVQLAYHRIFARANVHGGPHTLRHTFATMYLRAGGDVERLRRIMGHSDLKTTMIYLHLVHDDLVEAHRAVSPIHQFYTTQGRLI